MALVTKALSASRRHRRLELFGVLFIARSSSCHPGVITVLVRHAGGRSSRRAGGSSGGGGGGGGGVYS